MDRKPIPRRAVSVLVVCFMMLAAACQRDSSDEGAEGRSPAPQQPSSGGASSVPGIDEDVLETLPEFVKEGVAAQVEGELARADIVGQAREKIKNFVFLVKENRTFDHMFGRFPGAEGATEGLT
ncbi:MAG: hypothetical protein M3526_05025, partial [Actinomycetota bacterium]|nr:hypothetical protein [Actinomycetota bacterium]